jgi:uncharacterized iron-regulated membrane protein
MFLERGMTLNRLVFKTHKWLGVAVGALTLLWFVTGVVMSLPAGVLRAAPPEAAAAEVSFRDVKLSVPEAIAHAEAQAGKTFGSVEVSFRRLPGRLLYQVSAPGAGTFLMDALSGERLVIDEPAAREIAAGLMRGSGQVTRATLLRQHVPRYLYGPLPAYQVETTAADGRIYFIAALTGEWRSVDRISFYRALFHDAHSLAILRPFISGATVRGLLIATSAVGTAMSFFGMWILWIQWKNWLAARAERRARG